MKRSFLLALFCALAANGAEIELGSLGYQGHFEHPTDEYPYMEKQLKTQKAYGGDFVRTDVHWKKQEPVEGKWNFKRTDEVVAACEKAGVKVLFNILPCNNQIPDRYRPIMNNLDHVDRYVRTIVKRYKGRVRYWQIANEQDSGSNAVSIRELNKKPALYMELLKVCSKAIRETDPDAVVVAGGLAAPANNVIAYYYLEGMLKNGMAKYCDVVGFHPYPLDLDPEEAYPIPISEIRRMMKQYGGEKMQLWADEIGESSGPHVDWQELYDALLKTAGVKPEERELAVIVDKEWHTYSENRYVHRGVLGNFKKVSEIKLDGIRKLSADTVLLWTAAHAIPAQYVEPLVDFVRRGGTLIFPKGFPLYMESVKRADNQVIASDVGARHMAKFHVGWDAYWTAPKGDIPTYIRKLEGPGFDGSDWESGRVLSGKNLKPGDKLIPVVWAKDCRVPRVLAGVFKLNSDLKGTVIMNVSWGRSSRNVSPEEAGRQMSRQLLLLRAYGVDKVFIYKMRQYPHQTDYTYGLFTPEYQPLPSALGLATQVEVFPDGTKLQVVRDGKPWIIKGVRPDGKTAWAIWNPRVDLRCKLNIQGKVEAVYTNPGSRGHIGNANDFVAKPELTYILGPKSISIR